MKKFLNQYLRNPMPQQQMPQAYYLKGRPVSSFEEVRGTMVDFDGSLSYFPDLGNKRIYTKSINPDGTPNFRMYEEKEMQLDIPQYITRDEFAAALQELKTSMMQPMSAQAVPQTTTF